MATRSDHHLKTWRQLIYASGNFGVTFSPAAVAAWLAYFYNGRSDGSGEDIILVPAATFGLVWFLAIALNAISDPIIGYLSDHTRSRFGRRRPWVLFGAPLLALSFFFLWTPVTREPSTANTAVLFTALFFFWLFFTVVVAPYLSLLPEITPIDTERVRISAFMGAFEVVGTICGTALIPVLAVVLAGGLGFLSDGYQAMALITASVLLVLFFQSVLSVPEHNQSGSGSIRLPLRTRVKHALSEFGSTFRNRPFLPYVLGVGFYRVAVSTILFVSPYLATKVLAAQPLAETDRRILLTLGAVAEETGVVNWEGAAGLLMLLVLLGALPWFPLVTWASRRLGKRRVFTAALAWMGTVMLVMGGLGIFPLGTPLIQAIVLYLLAALPVACALIVIRPLLADVIDADAQQTGKRREGVYNGMEGLIMKLANGAGPLLGGALFALLGASLETHLGIRLCAPVAGVFLWLAAWAFTRYPLR